MINSEQLQKQFNNDNVSFIETDEGIVIIEINNQFAEARISMQGAQVLSWAPKKQKPVIWLSEDARFKKNKSIRGGIPVCWPWFGDHVETSSFPAHGFARTEMWGLIYLESLSNGATVLKFKLLNEQHNNKYWPYKTSLELEVTVSDKLDVVLKTSNFSEQDITLTEALHTYFNVSHINNVIVNGLNDCAYLDKTQSFKLNNQDGGIQFVEETDRVYVDTDGTVEIKDDGYNRIIRIKKSGSLSTVVWNPWQLKSDQMGDMGQDGHTHMVCVETANAATNAVVIPSGESHKLSVTYEIEAY